MKTGSGRREGGRGHTVGARGWVQYRVKLQMASIRQDKPAHMLELGLDFTPLLMSTAITSARKE